MIKYEARYHLVTDQPIASWISQTTVSTQRTYHRLVSYVKEHWFIALIGIIATITYAGIDAGFVYMLEPLLNKGFIAQDAWFIQWMPIIIFIAFTFRGLSSFISSYSMTWVARTIVMQFRKQLFNHFLHIKAKDYDQSSSGQLLSKLLYDSEQVAQVSMDALTIFIQATGLIIGLFIVMLTISWQLTFIYLLTVPIISMIVKITNRRIRRHSHAVQQAMGAVTNIAEESIEGYREVRIFAGQEYEKSKFDRASELSRHQDMQIAKSKAINVSAVQLIAACGIAYIVHLIMDPKAFALSAGEFSAMIAAMLAMLKPLKNFTTVNSNIQRGLAGAQSIFELLDTDIEKNCGQIVLTKKQGKIEFKDVCFSYENNHKFALDHISFTVEPGKTIALVGRSGSGKSTLASLLPRFYDVLSGKICINGYDIHDIDLASLRSKIAIVNQNVVLFNDTVYNNIAYGGLNNHSEKDIYQAAELAHATDFIENLPQGFKTVVGENGVLLSGGQRQRLAIARAALKKAPFLILDEATSALDTESERFIQSALQTIMSTCTTLVIAHRLSTIENADQIIVMDQGKIIEHGTHKILLNQKNFYAKLHAMQFSDTKP